MKTKSQQNKVQPDQKQLVTNQSLEDDYEHYPHAYTLDDDNDLLGGVQVDDRAAKSMIQNDESLSDMGQLGGLVNNQVVELKNMANKNQEPDLY